jgi:hypothetical protein
VSVEKFSDKLNSSNLDVTALVNMILLGTAKNKNLFCNVIEVCLDGDNTFIVVKPLVFSGT